VNWKETMRLPSNDPLAMKLVEAIQKGSIAELGSLLNGTPGLARAIILERSKACGSTESCGRSLLHIATDWPGNFPEVAQTIKLLVGFGAEVQARFIGKHEETPLHWAASSDDLAAIDALLECGADIEAKGGVIGGGTPLMDATAFGQWKAARRLVERGAKPCLWDAAALGMLDQVESAFSKEPRPDAQQITAAFWGACHGGQLATAEYLLQQGADLNWVGYDQLTPLEAARRSDAEGVVQWLTTLGARPAGSVG
jgi:hypothetical protein